MAETAENDRVRFEDALRDLEATVQRLESGELSLEESLAAFERGVALARLLNDKIGAVEQRVEALMRQGEGKLRTRTLDPELE
jgi:exodeoxyribonuclease VII small subunit